MQFLKAARGRRAVQNGLVLQAVTTEQEQPGIGFTVTKKAGTATERNRIKRRLRALVSTCNDCFLSRHDYVLIGRREVLSEPFPIMVRALTGLVARVHTEPKRPRRT